MSHKIPDHVTNSNLMHCIDEYVRIEQHRAMLKDRWFCGLTLEELSSKYFLSDTQTKKIIYDIGDKVLLKAAEM